LKKAVFDSFSFSPATDRTSFEDEVESENEINLENCVSTRVIIQRTNHLREWMKRRHLQGRISKLTLVATRQFGLGRALGFSLAASSLTKLSVVNSPVRPAGLATGWQPVRRRRPENSGHDLHSTVASPDFSRMSSGSRSAYRRADNVKPKVWPARLVCKS
jgi:hypothetical protein